VRSTRSTAAAVSASIFCCSAAQEHPEERVLGLGAVIESPDLAERARQPFWPQTRMGLVGYTPEGRQIRVAWFAHARLD
jgi:hypothetical protein